MALRAASWFSWVRGGRCEPARGLLTEIFRFTLGDVLGESVAFIWDKRRPCSSALDNVLLSWGASGHASKECPLFRQEGPYVSMH